MNYYYWFFHIIFFSICFTDCYVDETTYVLKNESSHDVFITFFGPQYDSTTPLEDSVIVTLKSGEEISKTEHGFDIPTGILVDFEITDPDSLVLHYFVNDSVYFISRMKIDTSGRTNYGFGQYPSDDLLVRLYHSDQCPSPAGCVITDQYLSQAKLLNE